MAIKDRWVMCENCGEPLGEDASATVAHCDGCDRDTPLPPRDETPIGGHAGDLDEGERFTRLRQQDGQPLLPPPGIEPLISGGRLLPHRRQEALEIYLATCRELRSTSDPAAQQRAIYLTEVFANDLDDPIRQRALLETTLDAVTLDRHRQNMRCMLAGNAARMGDFGAVEDWLALCDTQSDDLEMDSAWRLARATVDLLSEDWSGVLRTLGESPDDVPLADPYDAVTTVYRAHAHECLGDLERAATQLADAMSGGQRRVIERIIAHRPAWKLCERSLPLARERYGEEAGRAARSLVGGGVGTILLVVGGSVGLMGSGMLAAALYQLASGSGGTGEAPGLIIGGVVCAIVGFVVVGRMGWNLRQAGVRTARIRTSGLPGVGVVVGAERTGTEINDVPQMRIRLRVELEGRAPYEATTTLLVPPQNQGILEAGQRLYVRVDPDDPAQVVLDSG